MAFIYSSPIHPAPKSILIIGSGVFGLSTARALIHDSHYAATKITVIDATPFPNPWAASIDTSRIVRTDYVDPLYAAMGAEALEVWRQQESHQLGGEGRYNQSGAVMMASQGKRPGDVDYVTKSFVNIKSLMAATGEDRDGKGEPYRGLLDRDALCQVSLTGHKSSDIGYVNWRSGWADAESAMRFMREEVEATKRVAFVVGGVTSLIQEGRKIVGACYDGGELRADTTIVAAGAWSSKLVDLRGRATATGQTLCYLQLTEEEQERFGKMPVLLDLENRSYILPPKNGVLKVARHGYGYENPTTIPAPVGSPAGEDSTIEISLPRTGLPLPREGQDFCRAALARFAPELAERPWSRTRCCWYMDSETDDFLVDYHPDFDDRSLFLATRGCGQGFKFLPIVGKRIVDILGGGNAGGLAEKWAWPRERTKETFTEDISRGGPLGMKFAEEMAKSNIPTSSMIEVR